jgi:hypothetical protein
MPKTIQGTLLLDTHDGLSIGTPSGKFRRPGAIAVSTAAF